MIGKTFLTYPDYYGMLGIQFHSNKIPDDKDIKKAFHEMALIHHPDKPTGDTEMFKLINEANEFLSCQDYKKNYDVFRNAASKLKKKPESENLANFVLRE